MVTGEDEYNDSREDGDDDEADEEEDSEDDEDKEAACSSSVREEIGRASFSSGILCASSGHTPVYNRK
jgi:hypothetical protein